MAPVRNTQHAFKLSCRKHLDELSAEPGFECWGLSYGQLSLRGSYCLSSAPEMDRCKKNSSRLLLAVWKLDLLWPASHPE